MIRNQHAHIRTNRLVRHGTVRGHPPRQFTWFGRFSCRQWNWIRLSGRNRSLRWGNGSLRWSIGSRGWRRVATATPGAPGPVCSNKLRTSNNGGGGLHAVLDMSPSTTSKGPSTTSKGDMVQMSPSTFTLLWRPVITKSQHTIVSPHEPQTQSQPTTSTPKSPMEEDMGCQDQLDTSNHILCMTVILPNRMTWRQSAYPHDDYAKR